MGINKITLFDSDNYNCTDDWMSDLEYIIGERIDIPANTGEWVLLSSRFSRYGSIANHGKTGFSILKGTNLADALMSINCDRVVLKSGKDFNELQVDYHDHDGVNMCTVKYVEKSNYNQYRRIVQHGRFYDIINFIEELPSLELKNGVSMAMNI